MSKYSGINASGIIEAANGALNELSNSNISALNNISSSLSGQVASNVSTNLLTIKSEINALNENLNDVIAVANNILRYQELEKEVEELEKRKYITETPSEMEIMPKSKEEFIKKTNPVIDQAVANKIAELTREMESIEPSIR